MRGEVLGRSMSRRRITGADKSVRKGWAVRLLSGHGAARLGQNVVRSVRSYIRSRAVGIEGAVLVQRGRDGYRWCTSLLCARALLVAMWERKR